MSFSTSYLKLVPNQLSNTVDFTSKKIEEIRRGNWFDAIAIRGMSGATVGFPVSVKTGIPVIIVRKGSESSHGYPVEAPSMISRTRTVRYIILDDFICSGDTVKQILNTIQKSIPRGNIIPKCVGIVLYDTIEIGTAPRMFEDWDGETINVYRIAPNVESFTDKEDNLK